MRFPAILLLVSLTLPCKVGWSQESYSPKYISITWENDVFNGTDQYFTNGSNLTTFHPIFSRNPFDKLVPSLPKSDGDLYALRLRQDIYTPADVDSTAYLPNDRPFAGCLMLYMQRVSFLPIKKLRLIGNLGFGLIGNVSLAGQLQNGVHALIQNSIYGGWYNQLGNRLLLNYSATLEKALVEEPSNQFIGKISAEIGNLRTNLGVGYLWRLGLLAPYFTSYCYDKGNRSLYFSLFLDAKANAVIYDATLNGAYQNAGQPEYNLRRIVFKANAGLNCMYRKINLTLSQHFLTPEFSTGMTHSYFNIELGFRF